MPELNDPKHKLNGLLTEILNLFPERLFCFSQCCKTPKFVRARTTHEISAKYLNFCHKFNDAPQPQITTADDAALNSLCLGY